jgi:hypothetical protein
MQRRYHLVDLDIDVGIILTVISKKQGFLYGLYACGRG